MKKKGTKKKKASRTIDKISEIEDNDDLLEKKCQKLAKLIRNSRCTLVYTGAGCSTAASIPDYRGPNGVWTLAEKGLATTTICDPVETEPTTSHMSLRELYKHGYVRHVLSQNCDGLHLRSGLPQQALSEIHGNMYIEVCPKCKPLRQYIRSFDVTSKTRFRRHKTERQCEHCFAFLQDTIVHFGEHGKLEWPLNWKSINDILEENSCQLIVCLGSSMKILKKYTFLWPSGNERKKTKLAIVNLQWTPKDKVADLKINGKCDVVMKRIMEILRLTIPKYCRSCDPVLQKRRRNVRNNEILSRMTHCTCLQSMIPPRPSIIVSKQQTGRIPGWWTAGLSVKRQNSTSPNKRGRPCKRRRITKSGSSSPDRLTETDTSSSDLCSCSSETSINLNSNKSETIEEQPAVELIPNKVTSTKSLHFADMSRTDIWPLEPTPEPSGVVDILEANGELSPTNPEISIKSQRTEQSSNQCIFTNNASEQSPQSIESSDNIAASEQQPSNCFMERNALLYCGFKLSDDFKPM